MCFIYIMGREETARRKEDKHFLKKGFYFKITCFLCFFQTWNISNQSNLDWCTCSWSSEEFSPLKCLQLSHVSANCCRSTFLLTAWFGETSHNNVLSWAAVFQMSSEVIKMQIHSSKSPLILTATVSYWYWTDPLGSGHFLEFGWIRFSFFYIYECMEYK